MSDVPTLAEHHRGVVGNAGTGAMGTTMRLERALLQSIGDCDATEAVVVLLKRAMARDDLDTLYVDRERLMAALDE